MSLATITPTNVVVPAAPAGPVTLRDELALWQDAFEFAKAIASTDLVPKAFRNNPPAVMACIIKGHELGVPAMHALSQIHVIEGRPCMAAELQRALILAKGHDLWTEDHTVTRVTLCGRRRGGDHVQKVTWTTDDAKRAHLDGKPNWRSYPRAMLLARCSGELGRIMFADVLAGMSYNLEELTDGIVDMLELPVGEHAGSEPAAAPHRTRRTTKATKSAAAPPSPVRAEAAPAGPPAHLSEPGGPPPPLPGEEGYTDSPPPAPADTPPDAGERHTGPDPVPSETADPPAEPDAVVTKRAQAIAMHARDAGVDHHHVVSAVTGGNKASAKDLNAAEAADVLYTLADIRAGRVEILGSDEDGWQLVNPDAIEEPEESRVDEYQRRIRDLKAQKAELDRGGQQALPDPDERTES